MQIQLMHAITRLRVAASRLSGGVLVLLLAGCASSAGLHSQLSVSNAGTLQASQSMSGMARSVDAWPSEDWWAMFDDAQLDALVAEALARSPTLAEVQARIRRAEAIVQVVGADSRPATQLDASVTPQRFSSNGMVPPPYAGTYQTTARLAADLQWDLDFWGRNRSALVAATSRAEAARVDARAARELLAAALVRAYIEFDRIEHQRNLARAELIRRRDVARLVGLRVGARLAAEAEHKAELASVAQARAQRDHWDQLARLARNRLAALAGQGPDRGLALATPNLAAARPPRLPNQLPAELVGRRADLVAGRLRVAAAQGEEAAAKAAFYPNINLIAFAGLESIGLGELLRGDSGVVGIGPALTLPIFGQARLRGNLAARQAELDEAVAQYNGALVKAVQDVADQIAAWRGAAAQLASEAAAVDQQRQRVAMLEARYHAGLSDRLAVLAARGQVLQSQGRQADLAASLRTAAAGLAHALGGGFQSAKPVATLHSERSS
jgi:NodT family efflux transporter outer membrane factor (OMF) lipoprotein